MCPGEARTLTIQPEWAYGSRGMGPIPAESVLSKWFYFGDTKSMLTVTSSLRDRALGDCWREEGRQETGAVELM